MIDGEPQPQQWWWQSRSGEAGTDRLTCHGRSCSCSCHVCRYQQEESTGRLWAHTEDRQWHLWGRLQGDDFIRTFFKNLSTYCLFCLCPTVQSYDNLIYPEIYCLERILCPQSFSQISQQILSSYPSLRATSDIGLLENFRGKNTNKAFYRRTALQVIPTPARMFNWVAVNVWW